MLGLHSAVTYIYNIRKISINLKYKVMGLKNLIGQFVIATGSCGIKKGEEVIGILSEDKGSWVVTIILDNEFKMPCTVYSQTIRKK